MPRTKRKVTVVCIANNIYVSAGKLMRGDQAEIPWDEAEEIVERDKREERRPRIVVVNGASGDAED